MAEDLDSLPLAGLQIGLSRQIRFDDVKRPVFADVNFSVTRDRTTGDNSAEFVLSKFFPFGRVDDIHRSAIFQVIHAAIDQQRSTLSDRFRGELPPETLLCDVSFAGRLEREDRAERRRVVEELFRMTAVDVAVHDDRRRVDAASRGVEAEDDFPGARLNGINRTVTSTGDDRGLTVHNRHERRAVGCVFWTDFGALNPNRLAGGFVEGDVAVSRDRVLIPAGHHAAEDHEVFKHDREIRPAAIGAEDAVFLHQRAFPDCFTGLAVDALADAAQALQEDATRRRITDDARPADSFSRSVSQEHVVDVLPQNFAGVDVGTDDFLALFGRLRFMPANGVELAVEDDRRAACGQLFAFPDEILAVCRPTGGEILFPRDAGSFRTAPHRPVQRVSFLAIRSDRDRDRNDRQRQRDTKTKRGSQHHGNSFNSGSEVGRMVGGETIPPHRMPNKFPDDSLQEQSRPD